MRHDSFVWFSIALMVSFCSPQPDEEPDPYETEPPPAHCKFTDWEEWGPCTAPCGGGVQSRHRFLRITGDPNDNSSTSCVAADSGHRACNKDVCSSDCMTSTWSVYGHCDCKTEIKKRNRQILQWPSHGGEECGELRETIDCPEDCMQDCTVDGWAMWSECSATCGISKAVRSRKVVKKQVGVGRECPKTREARACPLFECPNNGTYCAAQMDGVFANPRAACSQLYLTCEKEEEIWQKCPNGLVFDSSRRRCEKARRVHELSHETLDSYVPIRNATLVGSFVMLLLILACLVKALTWHVNCCGDSVDIETNK